MDVMDFIKEELLILIPFLNVIGYIIKNTNLISNKFIPLILVGLSIVMSLTQIKSIPEAIIQGVLIAGASVLVHQIYKNNIVDE